MRPTEPPEDCPLCPRLAAFRDLQRASNPDWFNAPVPAFGDRGAWLAIVGLAPGLRGANRTGRPFTGDSAGSLLYETLGKFGLTIGCYDSRSDDGLTLCGVMIVNAVRCLPPQNRPAPEEVATCRPFLEQALAALPSLRVIVTLGKTAHDSTAKILGYRPSQAKFGHGVEYALPRGPVLLGSYHCSRYNQNTGRLTPVMFETVFGRALALRDQPARAASM
jgi:uracil-DNA glycosylase family 4